MTPPEPEAARVSGEGAAIIFRERLYEILRAIGKTPEPTSGLRIGMLSFNESVAYDAIRALVAERIADERRAHEAATASALATARAEAVADRDMEWWEACALVDNVAPTPEAVKAWIAVEQAHWIATARAEGIAEGATAERARGAGIAREVAAQANELPTSIPALRPLVTEVGETIARTILSDYQPTAAILDERGTP